MGGVGDAHPLTRMLTLHAGTDMTSTHPNPLLTPFDRKKAAAIGLRKWVRFASDGETTIMQVSCSHRSQQDKAFP